MAQRRPIDVAVTKTYGAVLATTLGLFGIIAIWVWLTSDFNGRQFPYLNTAFVLSWLIGIAMVVSVLEYARRRPADAQMTWGSAMIGSMWVFLIMFWVYGVIPHQWLTFADNELGWRADNFLIGPSLWFTPDAVVDAAGNEIAPAEGILEWLLPFDLTYLVVRDVIAVVIYGFVLGMNVAMMSVWQNRGKEAPADDIEQSTYGRPLVREGV